MVDPRSESGIAVPDFSGAQALDAWLRAHDLGLFCQGPDPDGPAPVMHGRVVEQLPAPGTVLGRWGVVTLHIRPPDEPVGVREPREPLPWARSARGAKPLPPET